MGALTNILRIALPPVGALASVATVASLWPVKLKTRADFATPQATRRETWVSRPHDVWLRVVEYGPENAPPIVFSHCWTGRAEIWNSQIDFLAQKFRVITYDQRGHGHSSLGKETVTIAHLGDDLSAILSATLREEEKALIIGHSMGGMSIMAWAQQHPEEVNTRARGVVLTGTGPYDVPTLANIPLIGSGPLQGKVAVAVIYPLTTLIPMNLSIVRKSTILRAIFRSFVLAPDAEDAAVDLVADYALTCDPRARAECLKAILYGLDVRQGVRNLTVPTVVVAGAKDPLTPPVHSYWMADTLSELGNLERLVVYPNSGHMIMLEETEEYNNLLLEVAERDFALAGE